MRIRGFGSFVEGVPRAFGPGRKERGSTLIEILVVIAVMALMFAIALPAITQQIANAEVHQGTREVVGLLRRVRASAINQQAPHYVVLGLTELQVWRCQPNADFTDCTWAQFESPVTLPRSVNLLWEVPDFPAILDIPGTTSVQPVPEGAVFFSPRGGDPTAPTPGEEYEITIDSVRGSTSRRVTVVRETGHVEIESP